MPDKSLFQNSDMHKCSILIGLLLLSESCYGFQLINWCSGDSLEKLIKCLLATDIQPQNPIVFTNAQLNSRRKCAKKMDCQPRIWEIFSSKFRPVKDYAKCMKKIDPLKDTIPDLISSEYTCRKNLADQLPDQLKGYYYMLLPQDIENAVPNDDTFQGWTW